MQSNNGINTQAIVYGLFTLAASTLAFAQSNAPQFVEELMVTASRSEKPISTIANTVTLIDQQELSEQLSINNDLSTLLGNLIPSFSPSRQKMTGFGESLRGRSPLYMIDGVPQSNPLRDGSRDGHTIDPIMLDRIEVIHGANAIHGLGASGGIINLITRRPSDEWQQSLRIDTRTQSADTDEALGTGFNYSISGRHNAIDVLASISYREAGINYDADDRIIGFDNAQGDTMDSDTLNLFLKTGYEWNDQRIELTVNQFELEGNDNWVGVSGSVADGIPTTAVESNVPGEPVSNEVTMYSVAYSHENFFGQALNIQVFDQEFSGTYGGGSYGVFQDPAFGPNLFDQSQNNSRKQGMKLTLSKKALYGKPFNIVYGADILSDETYQELILTGRNWVPESEYESLAFFVQGEYSGIENLTVTAGARHEESSLNVDDFTTLYAYGGGQLVTGGEPEFSETLSNIGAIYLLGDSWGLFGNISEGFSMPDVGRVLRGIKIPDQSVSTFLALEPIVTENSELGVEYRSGNIRSQLSYYTSESDVGQRLQIDADGIYSVQREQTEIDGIEFRVEWLATATDTFGLRYANTEGQYDADDNGRVETDLDGANMSPDRINLSWNRNWSNQFGTRLQVSLLQDREFKNAAGVTTAEFDAYTTVDFFADLETRYGNFRLGIQNLTNEDYFTYYSQTLGTNSRNFKGIGRSIGLEYGLQF